MIGDDVRSILAVAQYSRNRSREENGVEGLVSVACPCHHGSLLQTILTWSYGPVRCWSKLGLFLE